MKFSMTVLAFLFGDVYVFSDKQNIGISNVEAAGSPAISNNNGFELRKEPESLLLGVECDTNKDDCQCYGKKTFCGCGWFGAKPCICKEGTIGIEKRNCPNKEEWEDENVIAEEPATLPKSIPFGNSCDIDKDDCQCYGKRGICVCGLYGCACTIGDIETEIKKRNCPNKEEWESE